MAHVGRAWIVVAFLFPACGGHSPGDNSTPDAGEDAGPSTPRDAGLGISCVITEPVVPPGTIPPAAPVSGTSDIEVTYSALVPFESITVSNGADSVLTWRPTSLSGFVEAPVDWSGNLGSGVHTLGLQCTLVTGQSVSSRFAVHVN